MSLSGYWLRGTGRHGKQGPHPAGTCTHAHIAGLTSSR